MTHYDPHLPSLQGLDSHALGTIVQEEALARTIRDEGYGSTPGALELVRRHLEATTENLGGRKASLGGVRVAQDTRSLVEAIGVLDDELVALVALQEGLQAVATGLSLAKTYRLLGRALEAEVWAAGLRSYDTRLSVRLERLGRHRGSLGTRRQAVRSMAKTNGYETRDWDSRMLTYAGAFLVEVLLLGDLFLLDERSKSTHRLTITEEGAHHAATITRTLLEAHPVSLPLLEPMAPWTKTRNTLRCSGRSYEVPLIRRGSKVGLAHLTKAIKDGSAQPVLDALNVVQGVAWSINAPVLEVLKRAHETGVAIPGVPHADDLPVPEKLTDEEWGALSEDAQRLHRRRLAGLKSHNRGLSGQRMAFSRDITIAEILLQKGNTFWTPYNMDYRGRIYSTTHFGFQRQDYVRGLFLFKEGRPLGNSGMDWLLVHLANSGDFYKVSKRPYGERRAWSNRVLPRVLSTASDPFGDLWWLKADAPVQFLACCMEISDALASGDPTAFVSRLPVSFDGTCSGLQHLAAMTRCDTTADLVNLRDTGQPGDVYQAVADQLEATLTLMASDKDHKDCELAKMILEVGVSRNLVKRNVMTYSYSSPKYGMVQQQMDDTMRPLQDQVASGRLDKHPYEVPEDTFKSKQGETIHIPGKTSAQLLGGLIYDTIQGVVVKPAEAMRFLQGIATAMAHEGRSVVWKTPLGFPVVLHCPEYEVNEISLYLRSKGVRVRTQVNLQEEVKGIDKKAARSAVAPCFVHSMDACHLQMVALRAQCRGIHQLAFVHDSFGSLAGDAEAFRNIITEEFYQLYDENDVLGDILEISRGLMQTNHSRLPKPVTKGSYDIREVLDAPYAFA